MLRQKIIAKYFLACVMHISRIGHATFQEHIAKKTFQVKWSATVKQVIKPIQIGKIKWEKGNW